ncbi:hypothetical protein [Clostridium sardiniense]|uniref:hypothetical protein n=1 Tax=Clostridium sardiniense TaxID=29369 RepID=UPI003D32A76C
MDISSINLSNFFNAFALNARLGDESGEPESEERRRYFLEIDLEIVNLEMLGTSLSLMSSLFYLKATFVGKEIVLSALNGIDSGLDATPYVDVGETLGLMVTFIFTYSSFKRYIEKSEQDPEHQDPYRRIAMSYIPTLIAYLSRVNARREIVNTLPNI